MDPDEQAICDYLKSWPREFVSAREICRRAAETRRFRENPYWAEPVLVRLVETGILETDSAGHYRLAPVRKTEKPRKWISPELRAILEKSGKQFDDTVNLDAPEDSQLM